MYDAPLTVEQFIRMKVLPEYRDVVEMLRKLIREVAPNAREMISYGIPTYKGKGTMAVISPTMRDITFTFSRGAKFEDKYGLLEGSGAVSKGVRIKSVAAANKEALRYYIRQAVELDAR